MYRRLFRACLALCLMAAGVAQAADLLVGASQTYTTYADAYAAAVAGDTIIFMDAGPYGSIGVVNKDNLTIKAAPGVDVLINNTAARSIDLGSAVGNFQFGSADGGRITLDGASLTGNSRYFRIGAAAAGTITVENTTFKGIAQDATSIYGVEFTTGYAGGAKPDVILRNVEMDMNATRDPSVIPASRTTPTYVQLLRYDNMNGGSILFDDCYLHNSRTTIQQGGTGANSHGTIEYRNCDINHLSTDIWDNGHVDGNQRYGSAFTNSSGSGTKANTTIRNSIIRANLPTFALIRPTGAGSFTVENSVLINGAGGIMGLSSSSSLATGQHQFTGSDLISTQDLPSSGTLGKFVDSLSTTTVSLTLTQCNLYGAEGSSLPETLHNAVYTMNRCNDWSPANAYAAGWTINDSFVPGVNPLYYNAAGLDFRVGEAALRDRDLTVGSNTAFASSDLLVGVGQPYATIADALTAAVDGDTIRITDSGVYTETLGISKRVNIIADIGQTPTIRPAAGTIAAVITGVGANGGQFGSISGGKIIVDRGIAKGATVTANLFGIHVAGIDTGETYTIENVYITGFTTSGISVQNTGATTVPVPPIASVAYGVRGTLNINYVEVDNTFEPAEQISASNPAIATGIRVVGSSTAQAYNFGCTLNMKYVKVHRVNSHGVILNTSSTAHLQNVTLNMDNCEISTIQHGALILGNNTNFNVTANECLFLGGGGPLAAQSSWQVIRFGPRDATYNPSGNFTFNRCVAMMWPERGSQSVFVLRPASNDVNVKIDHCDIIAPLGGPTGDPAIPRARLAVEFDTGTNRNLEITNTIIYGPAFDDTITTPVYIDGIRLVEEGAENNVVTLNHNSVFVSGVPYSANLTPGAQEVIPAHDPMYLDMANWDFRVDNGSILSTASSTGGPIGSNRMFKNAVPVELSSFGLQ